jgi:hypothetical protein
MEAAATKTDPIAALPGSAKGERLLERLLQQRQEDRQRESRFLSSAGPMR